MRLKSLVLCVVFGAMIYISAPPAAAQSGMSSLSGNVTTTDGSALPGVTVQATSPALPGGAAVTITGGGGAYVFNLLPPGNYIVTFALDSFATLEADVKLSVGQSRRLDALMEDATVAEEIVVTGSYETISAQTEAQTTVDFETLEKLAVQRTIANAVILSPGTHATGPSDNITISGAMSFENLYLINGVVVNENLRGQPHDLYIEDAVQETTTYTSGVSAEYGRFGGGVVNTITKSGGNQFSGSLRVNFNNESWAAKAPMELEQADEVNQIYEATLGGFLWRDHLWFFLAGRSRDEDAVDQTTGTDITYPSPYAEDRYEGKLTLAPHVSHRFTLSYFEVETVETNRDVWGDAADLNALAGFSYPETGISGTYSGVITDNFFVELIYSEKKSNFTGAGPFDTSLAGGSVFTDFINGYTYNSAPFAANPNWTDERDNNNLQVKGSYFASGSSLGSHDIVFGYDTYSDIRKSNNHQTGSDHEVYVWDTAIDGDEVYPVVTTGGNLFSSWLIWWPILGTSQGTDFRTDSYFVNDTWRLNNRWSFNIGLRYDVNDGVDAEGKQVVDDAKLSPRLGVSYDLKGDGEWIINANYSNYTAAIANGIADESSAAGTPAIYAWYYGGPEINTDPAEALVDKETAMGMMWDWFFEVYGGHDNLDNIFQITIPGATAQINETLASPSTEEFSIGFSKRLGTRGLVRLDYVHREGADFYSSRIDTTTGQVEIPGGQYADLELIGSNDSDFERTYDGIHVAGQYRFGDRWQIGGTYTWSELTGNLVGETGNSGPVSGGVERYPEYHENSWAFPVGNLLADQRHKFKAWVIWDAIATNHHNLSLSVLANYSSGTHYSAVQNVDTGPYVTNPGYLNPDTAIPYYFSRRGAFTTDDITSLDFALNYSFFLNLFGGQLDLYIQPEVLNILNADGVIGINAADVIVAGNDPTGQLVEFNPFEEAPVRGTHWDLGEDFGQPIDEESYQLPRTYRFSVGIRF
jgi:hypothetical protein